MGTVKEKAPQSFQNGKPVETRFVKNADGSIGFRTHAYDTKMALTIDPEVTWATYFVNGESLNDLVADNAGNIYGATYNYYYRSGTTCSIVKFAPDGNKLWFVSYAGCTEFKLSIDRQGNIYGTGATQILNHYYNSKAVVVKFSPEGNLIWAKTLGTGVNYTGDIYSTTVCINSQGKVFMSGISKNKSLTFPGSFQESFKGGDADAFLAAYSSAGDLLWSTYYGGTKSEAPMKSITDAAGNLYVCGQAGSADFPVSNQAQAYRGGDSDIFMLKFSASGQRLWARCFGGSGTDVIYSCAFDFDSSLAIKGNSKSTDFQLPGNIVPENGQNSATFFANVSADGELLWGTFIQTGVSGSGDYRRDSLGNFWTYGTSDESAVFPLPDDLPGVQGLAQDCIFAKLAPNGAVLWATRYGGQVNDSPASCVVSPDGNIYFSGSTCSYDFPLVNPKDSLFNSPNLGPGSSPPSEAFLLKLSDPQPIVGIYSFKPISAGTGQTVTIKGKNFSAATTVMFGQSPATSFTLINDSTIIAKVGLGSTGSVKVISPTHTDSLRGFAYCSQLSPLYISVNRSPELCTGDSITLSGPANMPTYNWSNGATTRNITVKDSGSYSLQGTSRFGCFSNTSDTIKVHITPIPQQALITRNASGDSLICNTPGTITWFKSGAALSFMGRSIPVANAPGVYSATAGIKFCTGPVSLPFTVLPKNPSDTLPGDTTASDSTQIIITGLGPNPCGEYFNLYYSGFSKPLNINVIDLLGRNAASLQATVNKSGSLKVATAGIAEGVYTLKIQTDYGIKQLRLVKQ